MSYASESKLILRQDDVTDGQYNTSDTITIFAPCRLLRVGAAVTVVADATLVLTITRRVTIGSDDSAEAVTTVTIPNTTAAGKVMYKDITPIDLNPGDQLKYAWANSGTTGRFQGYAEVIPRPEVPANLGDMVASA